MHRECLMSVKVSHDIVIVLWYIFLGACQVYQLGHRRSVSTMLGLFFTDPFLVTDRKMCNTARIFHKDTMLTFNAAGMVAQSCFISFTAGDTSHGP